MKMTINDEKRPAMCYDQDTGEWLKGIVHPCMSCNLMWCVEMEDGTVSDFHHNQVRFLDSETVFRDFLWTCVAFKPKEEA